MTHFISLDNKAFHASEQIGIANNYSIKPYIENAKLSVLVPPQFKHDYLVIVPSIW